MTQDHSSRPVTSTCDSALSLIFLQVSSSTSSLPPEVNSSSLLPTPSVCPRLSTSSFIGPIIWPKLTALQVKTKWLVFLVVAFMDRASSKSGAQAHVLQAPSMVRALPKLSPACTRPHKVRYFVGKHTNTSKVYWALVDRAPLLRALGSGIQIEM